MGHQNIKLSRQYQGSSDAPKMVYVSKKHGVMYIKGPTGKGMDFSHPVQIDLSNYEEVDDNVLYRIYQLKTPAK